MMFGCQRIPYSQETCGFYLQLLIPWQHLRERAGGIGHRPPLPKPDRECGKARGLHHLRPEAVAEAERRVSAVPQCGLKRDGGTGRVPTVRGGRTESAGAHSMLAYTRSVCTWPERAVCAAAQMEPVAANSGVG